MKTYSAKPIDVKRTWYIVDAQDATLGRIATQIAIKLMGKDKPMFTHHIDCGDYIVVINADKLRVTGDKMRQKKYYRYSGFPSGLTELSLAEVMAKDSSRAVKAAVKGMVPSNKLRQDRLARLYVYPGAEHKHEAQKPVQLKVGK